MRGRMKIPLGWAEGLVQNGMSLIAFTLPATSLRCRLPACQGGSPGSQEWWQTADLIFA